MQKQSLQLLEKQHLGLNNYMSTYFTYAQFISCSDLVDFQKTHKMELRFTVPPTINYQYDYIEIYRYIGPYMECVNSSSITENSEHSTLIYKAEQQFSNGQYSGKTTIKSFFPNSTPPQTLNVNLTGINSFVDDFTTLTDNGTNLRVRHDLNVSEPGNARNFYVISDIGFTRRTIFYVIKTYIKGVADAAPYLLTPDNTTSLFSNHSTKTQVRHNYLHYEGDEIWSADLSTYTDYQDGVHLKNGISRTAVDINRLYRDALHAGPTGRGGYGWVSDRSTGKIFRHNLKDGALDHYFDTNIVNRGFGIGIDGDTGDCIAAPGSPPKLYRCTVNDDTLQKLSTNLGGGYGYGVIPIYGKPDRMLVTDYRGAPRIVFFKKNPVVVKTGNPTDGYAACSAPNGKGLQAGVDTLNERIIVINTDNASNFSKDVTVNSISKVGSSRISTDSYKVYPNTILSPDGDRDLFAVVSQNEYGMHIPSNSTKAADVTITWAVSCARYGTYGFDSENNLWVVNGASKRKYYRTAGNHTPGGSESYDYPYGGLSRYPTTSLDEWPLTQTNTREIDWFLTRNHQIITLVGTTQTVVNNGTLDNGELVDWDPDRVIGASPGFQTASAAWVSMTDERMYRKHDGVEYFNVYKSDGSLYGSGKKWGIRMDISDIAEYYLGYTPTTSEIDYFYEHDVRWQAEIQRRIRAWYNSFANTDLSYSGVLNRAQLIQGNQTGTRVHPFYGISSTVVQDDSDYYINETYFNTAEKKEKIETYIKNIKTYDFRNKLVKGLYMYSDFTGSILAGTIESSPLNSDIIFPNRTSPSLLLLLSGYQSDPGSYPYLSACYPWKNTTPASMSALYSGITGYDDFNTTFKVSANMGSFLLTSLNVWTDDFISPYQSDLGNVKSLSAVINTVYNSNNIYQNSTYFNYTYHSPSENGLYYIPSGGGILTPATLKSTGFFKPSANITVIDLYSNTGGTCTTITSSTTGIVTVLERWPEPKFYIDAVDQPTTRQSLFCKNSWGYPERYDREEYTYKESNREDDGLRFDIVYGVDPLSADIQDRSIARTWPISSWYITISTNNNRLLWPSNTLQFSVSTNDNLYVLQDRQNKFQYISGMNWRYGDYVVTMNVQASSTGTESDKPFIQYVKISEFEPFANFWAVSAATVPSNFVANSDSITSQLVNISPVHNAIFDGLPVVSGYAPNLTVWFQDSSESHTFPIKSYHWDFGDPFNEGPQDITNFKSNYYTITNVDIISGTFIDPCWETTQQAHTAVHTYIMPGMYSVTLTVKASETNTTDICARYISNQTNQFYVYVEEMPPTCGDGIWASYEPTANFSDSVSTISGDGSPVTAYFMSSSIIAGSFPICRIDWDFGDGVIETVTRVPYSNTTTQGLPLINISAYNYDIKDPRNIVVPHIYTNKTNNVQSFDIHLSAYACNTNTFVHCSAYRLVSPLLTEPEYRKSETKQIIGSRFDEGGNIIYILEGQTDLTTHTVILTGEIV